MMILKKLLLCLFALTISICIHNETQASQKWTSKDTLQFYKGLPLDRQKAFMKETTITLQQDLPAQVNEYIWLTNILYLASVNTLCIIYRADVQYGSVDKGVLEEFASATTKHSTNSICTSTKFQMFMFESNTVVTSVVVVLFIPPHIDHNKIRLSIHFCRINLPVPDYQNKVA